MKDMGGKPPINMANFKRVTTSRRYHRRVPVDTDAYVIRGTVTVRGIRRHTATLSLSRELADRIEYEWKGYPRLAREATHELTLPEDLYVFDTTLDWVIVFTHSIVTTPETRFCRVFGV